MKQITHFSMCSKAYRSIIFLVVLSFFVVQTRAQNIVRNPSFEGFNMSYCSCDFFGSIIPTSGICPQTDWITGTTAPGVNHNSPGVRTATGTGVSCMTIPPPDGTHAAILALTYHDNEVYTTDERIRGFFNTSIPSTTNTSGALLSGAYSFSNVAVLNSNSNFGFTPTLEVLLLQTSNPSNIFLIHSTPVTSNTNWNSSGSTFCIPESLSGQYNAIELRLRRNVVGSGGSSSIYVDKIDISRINHSIAGPATTCRGTAVQLTASGGGTYLWSNGATTASINVNPTTTTTYTVTITTPEGCISTASHTLTVNPVPTVNITANPNTICQGNSTQLTATFAAGNSYVWNTGATTNSINVTPNTTTAYTVVVTNSFGCVTVKSRSVTVYPRPTVTIGGNTAICQGSSTQLTASGGGTYLWSTGATTATIAVTPSSNTTYTVTVTSAQGCTQTASKSVTINDRPNVSISGLTSICDGSQTTLAANVFSSFTCGPVSYLWSTGATTQSATVTPTVSGTSYQVTVTCQNTGCTQIASTTVYFMPQPAINLNYLQTMCEEGNTLVSIDITPGGGEAPYTYAWNTGDLTEDLVNIPVMLNKLCVTVTDTKGCTGVRCFCINLCEDEFFAPNEPPTTERGVNITRNTNTEIDSDEIVLEQNTPNPFNGKTTIEYELPSNLKNVQMIITDLTGKQIKTFELAEQYGVVSIAAEELPAGTFFYSLTKNGIVLKSHKMIVIK